MILKNSLTILGIGSFKDYAALLSVSLGRLAALKLNRLSYGLIGMRVMDSHNTKIASQFHPLRETIGSLREAISPKVHLTK